MNRQTPPPLLEVNELTTLSLLLTILPNIRNPRLHWLSINCNRRTPYSPRKPLQILPRTQLPPNRRPANPPHTLLPNHSQLPKISYSKEIRKMEWSPSRSLTDFPRNLWRWFGDGLFGVWCFCEILDEPGEFGFWRGRREARRFGDEIWVDGLHPTSKMHRVVAEKLKVFFEGYPNSSTV